MPSTRLQRIAAGAVATFLAATPLAAAQIIYPFPPYPHGAYDASLRLDVTPKDAEVYVDGYYAGVVDSFDGVFQRLRVEPGSHEIVLYREGFRTYRQALYLARDRTFTLELQMEPLAPGEAGEARPVPASAPAVRLPPRPLPGQVPPTSQSDVGRLSIRVQPPDAQISIDGQPWPAPSGPDPLVIDLPEGRHVVQALRSGYVGYLTEVDVRGGETTSLDVNLRPQP
jgi:hypothetical protein